MATSTATLVFSSCPSTNNDIWNKLITACILIQHFNKFYNTTFAVKSLWYKW